MHMAMAWIWTGMAAVSLIFAAWNGTMDAVGAAALEGAGAAVQLCIAMAGVLCLWSGVMEIMSRCGLSGKLAALLRPALRRLLPRASRDPETLAAVSANVSANLLGLGNAATPLGIRAARRMARGTDGTGRRRAVPPGGAEHGVAAAAAHHGGRGAGGLRLPDALRYPAGGMAVVGHLRDGGAAGGTAAPAGVEGLTWTPRHL